MSVEMELSRRGFLKAAGSAAGAAWVAACWTRSALGVNGLALGARVEIECIAAL